MHHPQLVLFFCMTPPHLRTTPTTRTLSYMYPHLPHTLTYMYGNDDGQAGLQRYLFVCRNVSLLLTLEILLLFAFFPFAGLKFIAHFHSHSMFYYMCMQSHTNEIGKMQKVG